jgi:hypothetical protein
MDWLQLLSVPISLEFQGHREEIIQINSLRWNVKYLIITQDILFGDPVKIELTNFLIDSKEC